METAKVYVVLSDYGQFDGGSYIIAIYTDKDKAERRRIEEQGEDSYPEMRVEEKELL